MSDIKRSSKKAIQSLLKLFPCVAVLGARQVGKTTLIKQVLPKAPMFDLEKLSDYQNIKRDPDFFITTE